MIVDAVVKKYGGRLTTIAVRAWLQIHRPRSCAQSLCWLVPGLISSLDASLQQTPTPTQAFPCAALPGLTTSLAPVCSLANQRSTDLAAALAVTDLSLDLHWPLSDLPTLLAQAWGLTGHPSTGLAQNALPQAQASPCAGS